jgi:GT2 family glycosyltransferase
VLIVAPEDFDPNPYILEGLAEQFEVDPGLGLAEAINAGFESLPSSISLVNWLGDDDLLSAGSLEITSGELLKHPEIDLVFGSCDYIDTNGNKIWTNNSGQWAVPLLRFGPDMIPQPGALFRRSFFKNVGGADPTFGLAFDFELLLRMSKAGRLKFLNTTLASFRWHPESLSVDQRRKSVLDASRSRVFHLPKVLRPISQLWEFPVRQATLWAGNRVTKKALRQSQT